MMKQWQATQTAPGVWVFTWTPTAGRVYQVWNTGTLLATTAAGVGTYTTDPGGPTDAPPPLEIHDTISGKAQNEEYTPMALLQWRGVPACGGYMVERKRGSGWVQVDTATEQGYGWYIYNSEALVDKAEMEYRITALDSRGLGGVAVGFLVKITCNPRPPVVAIECLAGTITVEEV